MCKNIFTNENEFDLNGPITDDGVHYYGFGCSQILPDLDSCWGIPSGIFPNF